MGSRITSFAGVATFAIVMATTMNQASARCVEGQTGGSCVKDGNPGRMECVGGRFVCTPKPGQPPPFVSKPDVALELLILRCDDELEEKIVEALEESTGEANVLGQCKNGRGRFGIWKHETRGMDDDAARQRGLDAIRILSGRERFGMFFDARAIRREAEKTWEETPRHRNEKGKAFEDNGKPAKGPIHLTDFDIKFQEATNSITTIIKGYNDKPIPDVDFTLRVTDTLSLKDGAIQCRSKTVLDKETGLLHAITGLSLVLRPMSLGVFFAVESALVARAKGPGGLDDAGVGCPAAGNIPAEILLPDSNQKAVLSYSRLEVNNRGITAAGAYDIVPRQPRVSIIGPSTIEISSDDQARVAKSFTVVPRDLRPSLTRSWSSPSGTVLNRAGSSTKITWSLDDLREGRPLVRTVRVTVADADGLSASATRRVTIRLVRPQPPPICLEKPYLPQCNPGRRPPRPVPR